MKASIILVALIALLFIGCKSSVNSSDIKGTYVNKGESEYSVAFDTLIVSSVVEDKTFKIEERLGFQRIRDKGLRPKQFKQETWQVTWNPDTRVLSENEFGRQLLLKPYKKTLLIKNTEFFKIK